MTSEMSCQETNVLKLTLKATIEKLSFPIWIQMVLFTSMFLRNFNSICVRVYICYRQVIHKDKYFAEGYPTQLNYDGEGHMTASPTVTEQLQKYLYINGHYYKLPNATSISLQTSCISKKRRLPRHGYNKMASANT